MQKKRGYAHDYEMRVFVTMGMPYNAVWYIAITADCQTPHLFLKFHDNHVVKPKTDKLPKKRKTVWIPEEMDRAQIICAKENKGLSEVSEGAYKFYLAKKKDKLTTGIICVVTLWPYLFAKGVYVIDCESCKIYVRV